MESFVERPENGLVWKWIQQSGVYPSTHTYVVSQLPLSSVQVHNAMLYHSEVNTSINSRFSLMTHGRLYFEYIQPLLTNGRRGFTVGRV